MEHAPESPFLLIMAGIISLAIFYLSITASLFPQVLKLCRLIATKVHEYQALDRGDTLTLFRDAGLSHEQSLWFYDTFYVHAASWERCLIKLYIKKHCIRKLK
jgi:hypothetical protein